MNRIIKTSILALIGCLLLCCVGCYKADVMVEIKSDGTASLTTKVSLAEALYNNVFLGGGNENSSTENSLKASDFVREEIDGEVYYSYSETKDGLTLNELCRMLDTGNMDVTDLGSDSSLLKNTQIKVSKEDGYIFTTNTVIVEDPSDGSASIPGMTDDWLTLTLTVKMPGEVMETNGEIVGDKKDGTVRFILTDLTESKTLTVRTLPKAPILPLILCGVGLIVIAGATVVFFVAKKNKKNAKKNEGKVDEMEEKTEDKVEDRIEE